MLDAIDSAVKEVGSFESNPSSTPVIIILFNALVYATSRYIPEYLRVLGTSPVVIGLFGTIILFLNIVNPYLAAYVRRRSNVSFHTSTVGVCASIGLVVWLLAPQLGRLWSIPVSAYVIGGAIGISMWRIVRPETFSPITDSHWLYDQMSSQFSDNRTLQLAGLMSGVLLATGLIAGIAKFVVGFQVLIAVTASFGITVSVVSHYYDIGGSEIRPQTLDRSSAILSDVYALSNHFRPLLIGDTLVRWSLGMISVFIIIIVTNFLQVDVSVVGYRLSPSAFFGVLLLIEIATAVVTTIPAVRLADRTSRTLVVFVGFFVAAIFPLLLVGVPRTPLMVSILFAIYGLHLASRPVQDNLIFSEISNVKDVGMDTVYSYRIARDVVAVPSTLIGGLLYSISPTFMFVCATIIGILGVREFMRFAVRSHFE